MLVFHFHHLAAAVMVKKTYPNTESNVTTDSPKLVKLENKLKLKPKNI